MGRNQAKNLAFWSAVLLLLLMFVFSGLRLVESAFSSQEEEAPVRSKTIERDGVAYFPRQDITVVMVLGIGEWGEAKPAEWNEACAVDMVNLMVFDEKEESITVLSLNRDTMLWMPKFTPDGKEQGQAYRQLTYSHKFCTGMEDSCENVQRTVSEFLGGITIDYYVSMRLDAIAIMNDAVGGVTVNVTEDFSKIDPSITKGQCTLKGKQAVAYVRTRREVGDGRNVSRMNRQQDYIRSFLNQARQKNDQDSAFLLNAYEQIAPYLVTNCSANVLSSMMQRYADYSIDEYVTPEGENILGEEYMEFHVDEDRLDELVVRLFYAPKK